jgi:hypothetical protein
MSQETRNDIMTPNAEATATESQTASAGPAPMNLVPPYLDRAPLAYENSAFLNSADGRLIRILAEYTEPLARFRRERIQDTVVFFGSARFRSLEHASENLELLVNGKANAKEPTAPWNYWKTPALWLPHPSTNNLPAFPTLLRAPRRNSAADAP